ncbi:MAG: glycerate kinase [Collinsella sp.]
MFGGQKGLPTDDAEALRRYDSWMVGYGRLLDAAITGVRAQGLLRVPEGARTFGSVLGCLVLPQAAWCRAAGARGGAAFGRGDGARFVGFDERVRDVDLVITGEGNMDEQSAAGKAPVGWPVVRSDMASR